MLRKLPLAMAIALAVMPIQSQALGLGDITTNSVLNQAFNAEIQLLSVAEGELDGVKVDLASPEAFQRAGVERPFLLSYLRFKTIRKNNGEAAIQVTSRQSIKEPFLNFLVEVDWPRGRMVREFTVLLDPPMTTGRKQQAFTTPTTTSSTLVPSSLRTRAANISQGQSIAGVASDTEYGPVKRNETLWTIADRYRGAGITVNQMMIAILDANPQAFSKHNINNLKAGSILRIPSQDEVRNLSNQEAKAIARKQYNDWKNNTVSQTSALKTKPVPKAKAVEITQMPETEVMSSEETARLKLSGSEVASELGTGSDVGAVKQELISAQEKIVSSQGEAQELRSKMALIEQQLKDMQRLLELKDEQLSQLQAANDSSSDTSVVENKVADPESQAEDSTKSEPEVVEQPEPSNQAETVVESAKTMEPSKPVETTKAEPAKPVNLIDMITGSATLMGIAIAVFVVLIALIWAAFSRRKDNDTVIAPVTTLKEAEPEVADTLDAEEPVVDEHPEEETSFLSEFTPGDLNALHDEETGEVDPISEADVYIAYGRFDQAEELVQQALDSEPGKLLYQHKLLEIFYANKDQEKFTALATQMHEAGAEADDPDAWNRAKLMGMDVDPENPMFADALDAPSMDLTDDLDMALSELESQLTSDSEDPLGDLNAISEQLEDLNLDELAGKVSQNDPISELDSLSLDLDALESTEQEGMSENIVEEEAAIEELAAELESFDLDQVDTSDVQIETLNQGDELPTEDLLLPDGDLSSELDDVDDITTKIDLAQAYIEMGDKEGARGILEEVVEEGSDAQKQQAEGLLGSIS